MKEHTEKELLEQLARERASIGNEALEAAFEPVNIPYPSDHEPKWWAELEKRQQKEVNFALIYTQYFRHGTAGHTQYMLIAKLADLLDELEWKLGEGSE